MQQQSHKGVHLSILTSSSLPVNGLCREGSCVVTYKVENSSKRVDIIMSRDMQRKSENRTSGLSEVAGGGGGGWEAPRYSRFC
jgi:hypothetical protein